jgi:hypothetical protein
MAGSLLGTLTFTSPGFKQGAQVFHQSRTPSGFQRKHFRCYSTENKIATRFFFAMQKGEREKKSRRGPHGFGAEFLTKLKFEAVQQTVDGFPFQGFLQNG